MEFKESKKYSPMHNNIIEQSARVYEIINNAGKFKKYYNELINNIIDSINNQCKSYVRNSKKSIKIDIYDMVMESIDWSKLQQMLVTDLKNNKSVSSVVSNMLKIPSGDLNSASWSSIGSLDDYGIEQYDTDAIVNMYSNCSEESIKKYIRYMKEANSNLKSLETNVVAYEKNLCDYRKNAVNIILTKNVPLLYALHYNYVKNVIDTKRFNKNMPIETISINNVDIKLCKSQKEFITNSLKQLIV